MDRTNILNIVDELNNTVNDSKISITFLSNTKPEVDEPSIIITVETGMNIKVTFYLTENEANMMTFEDLNAVLGVLVRQEMYRRKVIFKNAVTSAKP